MFALKPKLSAPAIVVLQTFYLELRGNFSTEDGVPCTTRQLESLIRLAQARAKAELCELVSEDHAKEAVELMREALFAALRDEAGNLQLDRQGGMAQYPKSRQVHNVVDELKKLVRKHAKLGVREDPKLLHRDEIRDAMVRLRVIRSGDDGREMLGNLIDGGYILMQNHKYAGSYRVMGIGAVTSRPERSSGRRGR